MVAQSEVHLLSCAGGQQDQRAIYGSTGGGALWIDRRPLDQGLDVFEVLLAARHVKVRSEFALVASDLAALPSCQAKECCWQLREADILQLEIGQAGQVADALW